MNLSNVSDTHLLWYTKVQSSFEFDHVKVEERDDVLSMNKLWQESQEQVADGESELQGKEWTLRLWINEQLVKFLGVFSWAFILPEFQRESWIRKRLALLFFLTAVRYHSPSTSGVHSRLDCSSSEENFLMKSVLVPWRNTTSSRTCSLFEAIKLTD